MPDPMNPAQILADALPADPDDHGPIAVPSDAVRGVLDELNLAERALELAAQTKPARDGGA